MLFININALYGQMRGDPFGIKTLPGWAPGSMPFNIEISLGQAFGSDVIQHPDLALTGACIDAIQPQYLVQQAPN